MRLYINFKVNAPLVLPLNYQEILQGFIYNQIDDEAFAQFLHDKGYMYEKRKFKLFAYSRLMGDFVIDRRRKLITFPTEVQWQVSSCLPQLIKEFAQSLLTKDSLQLNGHPLQVAELRYQTLTVEQSTCTVNMLSPITIHSTHTFDDGHKTTQYFSPFDPAFANLIHKNLTKKYFAYYGEPIHGKIDIKPVHLRKRDKVITRFKGFLIEAWNGVYQLQGEPEILTFACTAGLGDRNSQGFGLPELRE